MLLTFQQTMYCKSTTNSVRFPIVKASISIIIRFSFRTTKVFDGFPKSKKRCIHCTAKRDYYKFHSRFPFPTPPNIGCHELTSTCTMPNESVADSSDHDHDMVRRTLGSATLSRGHLSSHSTRWIVSSNGLGTHS